MSRTYTVSLFVRVHDEGDLYRAAVEQARKDSPTISDAELADMLGTEAEPDVHNCLRTLADPGVSWDGTEIMDSAVEGDDPFGDDDDDGAPAFLSGADDGYEGEDGHWLVSRYNEEDGDTPGRAYLYEARFAREDDASGYLATSASIDPDALEAGRYSIEYVAPTTLIAGEPVLWLKSPTETIPAEVVKNGHGSRVFIKGEGFSLRQVDETECVPLWTNGGKPAPEIGRGYQLAYPFFGAAPDGLLADTMTYPDMTARRGELVKVLRWATLQDCDREAMPQVIIGDPEGGDSAFADPDFEGIASLDELIGPGMTKDQVIDYICDHFHDGRRPSPTTPVAR